MSLVGSIHLIPTLPSLSHQPAEEIMMMTTMAVGPSGDLEITEIMSAPVISCQRTRCGSAECSVSQQRPSAVARRVHRTHDDERVTWLRAAVAIDDRGARFITYGWPVSEAAAA